MRQTGAERLGSALEYLDGSFPWLIRECGAGGLSASVFVDGDELAEVAWVSRCLATREPGVAARAIVEQARARRAALEDGPELHQLWRGR